jgi:hypothetical protein
MFTTKQELERQVRDFIFNISFLQFLWQSSTFSVFKRAPNGWNRLWIV